MERDFVLLEDRAMSASLPFQRDRTTLKSSRNGEYPPKNMTCQKGRCSIHWGEREKMLPVSFFAFPQIPADHIC